jgi:prepilin-type N-terminal cleavage/methylation domain-containing protein
MKNHTTLARKRIRKPQQAGFTLVEIMIVVLIIGVLLNIAAPGMIGARDKAQAKTCIKNLDDFMVAKEQYAMDSHIAASNTTAVTWPNISSYIKAPPATNAVTGPVCPTNGASYNYNNLATLPACPYYMSGNNPLAIHSL